MLMATVPVLGLVILDGQLPPGWRYKTPVNNGTFTYIYKQSTGGCRISEASTVVVSQTNLKFCCYK